MNIPVGLTKLRRLYQASMLERMHIAQLIKKVEIETEEDGTILLESVVAHFPGTTTIKYKSPSGTG